MGRAISSQITHVILTRFNLATAGRESEIRNQPGWLAHRFDLFEQYCLPSVAAQTDQDFTWLVFFDDATPKEFRDRIKVCRAAFPFIPVFAGLFGADGWPNAVREHVAAPASWLLTSRLDNDDGIAVDYCERLRNSIEYPRRCALNFTNGFVLANRKLYMHRHSSNAFVSYLEPFDDNARTAWVVHHMEMSRHADLVQIGGPGAWLQVVHDRNVSNRARGYRVTSAKARSRFPSAMLTGVRDDRVALYFDNAVLFPGRWARDHAVTHGRRVLRGIRDFPNKKRVHPRH